MTTTFHGLAIERRDGIEIATLNRPDALNTMTMATLSHTVHGSSEGKAETRFATPDVTDTATVKM